MKAILVDQPGGPEVLRLGETADPVPGDGEVAIAVHAAGVNRADLLQRMGRYPPPAGASEILGLELAGTAEQAGARFRAGDRVMAVVAGGAYAERAAVPEAILIPVPDGLGWDEAAAIPEAFLTAWLNLVEFGRLGPGGTVLVHAGASGVGSAAIQLARALGARALATAGSDAKLELCRRLGAELAFHRERDDFATAAREATGGRGVDLVLDFVGAPYWARNLEALRRGGTLTLIGFLGGSRGDLDLGPVMRKNLTVTGTTLRSMPVPEKERLVEAFSAYALPRFASRELSAVVDRSLPLAEAAEAHRLLADNRTAGKIVLRVR